MTTLSPSTQPLPTHARIRRQCRRLLPEWPLLVTQRELRVRETKAFCCGVRAGAGSDAAAVATLLAVRDQGLAAKGTELRVVR